MMVFAFLAGLILGACLGLVVFALLVANGDDDHVPPPRIPQPDWGSRGTRPKGKAGPMPPPNGRLVATKPRHDWIDAW